MKKIWILGALICIFYLTIGLLAPVLSYFSITGTNQFYLLGRAICVQRPSRCVWYLNDHTALCGKCIGFYLGILFISLLVIASRFRVPSLKEGVVGFCSFLLVFAHSVLRSITGDFLFPVVVNIFMGSSAGIGLALMLWYLSYKWKERIMSFCNKFWVLLLSLIVAIHFLGFSLVLAADLKEKNEVLIPAGTPVILEVDNGFSTDEVKEGDTIILRVQQPVKIRKIIVVRYGIAAKARVNSCIPAAGWGGAGKMTLQIREVPAIDGSYLRLNGRASRNGETNHGSATAVGVGTGILCLPLALTGFAVEGEQGKFPPGYEIIAHTDGDHYVEILSDKELKKIANEQDETSRKLLDSFENHLKEVRKKKEEEMKTGSPDN